MPRPWMLLVAALAATVCCTPLPGAERLPLDFELSAESTEVLPAQNEVIARGQAVLTYRDLELRAGEIQASRTTGELAVSGGLVLTQGPRRLTAERAEYNLRSGRGLLLDATASQGPARFTGKRLEVEPNRYQIEGASFTTCDRPKPDYLLTARSLTYLPGERLMAKHAQLYLYGHRLLSVPSLHRSIRTGTAGLIPRVSYSSFDGPSIGLYYGFAPGGPNVTGSLDARLTSKQGVRGLLAGSYLLPWGQATLAASRRESFRERAIRIAIEPLSANLEDVTVDRAPETGVHMDRRPLLGWLEGEAWATAGRYRELPTEVDNRRLALTADLSTREWPLGSRLGLSLGLGARQAWYRQGEAYRVVAPRVAAHYLGGPTLDLVMAYQHRTPHGTTPFLFDKVEIGREVTSGLMLVPRPGWRTEVWTRYDTNQGRLRDAEVTLVRVMHCLEYSVGWRKVGSQIRLGMNLAGGARALLEPEAGQSRLQRPWGPL